MAGVMSAWAQNRWYVNTGAALSARWLPTFGHVGSSSEKGRGVDDRLAYRSCPLFVAPPPMTPADDRGRRWNSRCRVRDVPLSPVRWSTPLWTVAA